MPLVVVFSERQGLGLRKSDPGLNLGPLVGTPKDVLLEPPQGVRLNQELSQQVEESRPGLVQSVVLLEKLVDTLSLIRSGTLLEREPLVQPVELDTLLADGSVANERITDDHCGSSKHVVIRRA